MNKTLNVRFLTGIAIVCSLLWCAIHFLHAHQAGKEARALLAQADAAERLGDVNRAANYLRRYLTLDAGNTDARARLGLLMEQTARTTEERMQAFLEL